MGFGEIGWLAGLLAVLHPWLRRRETNYMGDLPVLSSCYARDDPRLGGVYTVSFINAPHFTSSFIANYVFRQGSEAMSVLENRLIVGAVVLDGWDRWLGLGECWVWLLMFCSYVCMVLMRGLIFDITFSRRWIYMRVESQVRLPILPERQSLDA